MKLKIIPLAIIFFCNINSSFADSCSRFITDGTFENDIDIDVSGNRKPIKNSMELEGGWYSVDDLEGSDENSPDLVGTGGHQFPGAPQSTDFGKRFVAAASSEAIGVKLAEPLVKGRSYILKFKGYGIKNPHIKFYFSDSGNKIFPKDKEDYDKVVKTVLKKESWESFSFPFTAKKNYKHMLFMVRKKLTVVRWAGIDNVEIVQSDCCIGNLVPNPGFEESTHPELEGDQGAYLTHWKGIVTHGTRHGGRMPRSAGNPIPAAVTSASEQSHGSYFYNLGSYHPSFGTVKDNDRNEWKTVKLKFPLKPGTPYRVKFLGASKNTVRHSKAHVDLKFSEESPYSVVGSGVPTAEEVTNYPAQYVMYNLKLDGPRKDWNLYSEDFIAEKEHQHLIIQAKKGYHAAIDEFCVTNEPFKLKDTKLYYNTANSLRHVDINKVETTLTPGSDYNFFGMTLLDSAEPNIMLADNDKGILQVKSKFNGSIYNKFNKVRNQSLVTDQVVLGNDLYILANYRLRKVSNGAINPAGPETVINLPQQLQSPFSIEVIQGHLVVAGVDKLAIVNPASGQSALLTGHGVTMSGFMTVGPSDQLIIADPGQDAIKALTSTQIVNAITSLGTSATVIPVGPASTISQGGLLSDLSTELIRGPIGVYSFGQKIWVTVDTGSGQPGRIITINLGNNTQDLYKTNIPGPRDIIVVQ